MKDMKDMIAKFDWLSYQRCSSMAWHNLRVAQTPPSEAELFRMRQGQEVGLCARQLYPTGILVSPIDKTSPAEITQALMAEHLSDCFPAHTL
jgi:hypothetical protein